jgi:hypothetical protein
MFALMKNKVSEWFLVTPGRILACSVVIVSLCMIFFGLPLGFLAYYSYNQQVGFERYLSRPLPDDTTRSLCLKQLVPSSLGDCTDPNIALEVRDVPELFRLNLSENATFDELDQLFGDYEFICYMEEEPYSCQYRIFIYDMIFHFDAITNQIVRVYGESAGS